MECTCKTQKGRPHLKTCPVYKMDMLNRFQMNNSKAVPQPDGSIVARWYSESMPSEYTLLQVIAYLLHETEGESQEGYRVIK